MQKMAVWKMLDQMTFCPCQLPNLSRFQGFLCILVCAGHNPLAWADSPTSIEAVHSYEHCLWTFSLIERVFITWAVPQENGNTLRRGPGSSGGCLLLVCCYLRGPFWATFTESFWVIFLWLTPHDCHPLPLLGSLKGSVIIWISRRERRWGCWCGAGHREWAAETGNHVSAFQISLWQSFFLKDRSYRWNLSPSSWDLLSSEGHSMRTGKLCRNGRTQGIVLCQPLHHGNMPTTLKPLNTNMWLLKIAYVTGKNVSQTFFFFNFFWW